MSSLKYVPQWISSDRLVTQTALELVDYEWLAESRVLKGKISLIASFPLTMRLRIPEGFYFSTAKCEGAQCEAKEEADNILALTFLAEKNGDFIFRIQY